MAGLDKAEDCVAAATGRNVAMSANQLAEGDCVNVAAMLPAVPWT